MPELTDEQIAAGPTADAGRELIEGAWCLLANAHGGDWSKAPAQWREAAERWRDHYAARLSSLTPPATTDELSDAAARCADRWGCKTAADATPEVVRELLDDAEKIGKTYLASLTPPKEATEAARWRDKPPVPGYYLTMTSIQWARPDITDAKVMQVQNAEAAAVCFPDRYWFGPIPSNPTQPERHP